MAQNQQDSRTEGFSTRESLQQGFFSSRKVLIALTVAGIFLRVVVTVVAGNRMTTPWRVGGDSEFYINLASTVAHGMGFTYAHQPTAFRPPFYPYFLAGMMEVFGSEYLLATRLLQCLVGFATVWVCWRTATRIFGEHAGWGTLLLALYFPSLAIFPTELMTECFATFLAAGFFYLILQNPRLMEYKTAIHLGLIVGLATLLRFNMAIFGPIAAWEIVRRAGLRPALANVALMAMIAGVIVAPWMVRNERVFHGQVLFSTQGGYNALQGVLTPQGRVQAGDLDTLRRAGSWLIGDLETNGPERLQLPSEPELDRIAWQLARHAWGQKGWALVPLAVEKLSYFWLSTDQLLSTGSFPWKIRAARAAGVVLYWGLLGLAMVGCWLLYMQKPPAARFILAYVLLISLAHLPFIMTSRHRIPFAEPLLVILGGAGCVYIWERISSPVLGRPAFAASGAASNANLDSEF